MEVVLLQVFCTTSNGHPCCRLDRCPSRRDLCPCRGRPFPGPARAAAVVAAAAAAAAVAAAAAAGGLVGFPPVAGSRVDSLAPGPACA